MTTGYSFSHLLRMTGEHGLFEHAEYQVPRVEHGYCVDDVARGLVLLSREQDPAPEVGRLGPLYLQFLLSAQSVDGRTRNRMSAEGEWQDHPSLEDCWGRSLWALGSAAARMPELRAEALKAFERGSIHRSTWLHANCFAALGAAEVLHVEPEHAGARDLLGSTTQALRAACGGADWPWPEPRLRYASGVIPQVFVTAGRLLDRPAWLEEGLYMLRWLARVETLDGHLSLTPVGGWAQHEARPGFDQQPIEAAALAEAGASALAATRDLRWLELVRLCTDWFEGVNDAGVPMTDERHSLGYDGLQRTGRNENAGAESTLAMLTTFQLIKNGSLHA